MINCTWKKDINVSSKHLVTLNLCFAHTEGWAFMEYIVSHHSVFHENHWLPQNCTSTSFLVFLFCAGTWWVLWGCKFLYVDSHGIIKTKSPFAIQQGLRSFAGLLLAPKEQIWTGPMSAGVKHRSLTPYCDCYPSGSSQCSAQHLIDINSPSHSGSSIVNHPTSTQTHTETHP